MAFVLSVFLFSMCLFFLGFHHSLQSAELGGSTKMSMYFSAKCASSTSMDPTKLTQISSRPRAYIYRGFLKDEECFHLKNLAEGKLNKSIEAEEESGIRIEYEVSARLGISLDKAQDEVVAKVEARVAALSCLLADKGGRGVASIVIYLSDVKRGGETVFPRSKEKETQAEGDEWSECAKQGYAVKPKKGNALLFFNLRFSCPVIEGEKWTATKRIDVSSFHKARVRCIDQSPDCDQSLNLSVYACKP